MALINCSMEKKTIIVSSGSNDVASVTLEIIPDPGYVVAARDFTAGPNPDATKINSITLTDSESTGGPQNDGSYTTGNKVIVTVDFVDSYAPTENITLDIDPSGSATAEHLIPVKLQGTFVVPDPPDKVTFVASSVEDFASSPSTADFYAYDNPGDIVTIMVMTIAATTNDFIDDEPTVSITNTGNSFASEDYQVEKVKTLDSSDRLIQVVYTIKATIPKVSRTGDVITFTGSGEDIPGIDKKIYAYKMNTGDAGLLGINRRLEIYGDKDSQFRIKMQRGTLDTSNPPVFTIDSTDGIYVFDNSKDTISDAFEPSTSTTTYPSEIQSDGTYDPATDPYTIGDTGLFFRNIVIPEDVEDKVYRFTIIPETGTTIDASAPGIDTSPDPDVITFDITRKGYAFFTSDYDAPSRDNLTNTIKYYDYLFDDKGSVEPKGRKSSDAGTENDVHYYELVITDDNEDFHLPNEENSYTLKEFNYTETLNNGSILRPVVVADLRASDAGFNAGKISGGDAETSHSAANSLTANIDVVFTVEQREALTNKTSFNMESFSDNFAVTGTEGYLKVEFFTTDETPVYKSQTIEVSSNYDVTAGEEGQQNTTTQTTPALNRRKLYITGDDLNIITWGSDDMRFRHNLDTFAFKTAQSSTTTLDIKFDINHIVSKFINSVGRAAKYTDDGYSTSILISNDGGSSYIKQNITTSTTHAKLTITGAYIYAQDLLPVNFDTNDYQLLFTIGGGNSSELSSVNLSIPAQPAVSLDSASTFNRKLTVGSGDPNTFEVIIDFNGTLTSLVSSSTYTLSCVINHRLSSSYQDVGDAEEYYGLGTGGVVPSPF